MNDDRIRPADAGGFALNARVIPLRLRFPRWIETPAQPVVTLRGLLGYALLDYLHPGKRDAPADSLYWPIFKPAPRVPHPFLVHCDPGAGHARELTARLIFFGRGAETAPLCVAALEEAAETRGWTSARVPFELDTCPPWDHVIWPPAEPEGRAERVRLSFVTPAQLTWRNAPLKPDDPVIHVIVWAALRRLRALAEHYGTPGPFDAEAAEAAIQAARPLRVSLSEVHERRTSSLGQREVSIGGLAGFIELDASCFVQSALRAAEWTGLGKKVFAGNGRVRLERLEDY